MSAAVCGSSYGTRMVRNRVVVSAMAEMRLARVASESGSPRSWMVARTIGRLGMISAYVSTSWPAARCVSKSALTGPTRTVAFASYVWGSCDAARYAARPAAQVATTMVHHHRLMIARYRASSIRRLGSSARLARSNAEYMRGFPECQPPRLDPSDLARHTDARKQRQLGIQQLGAGRGADIHPRYTWK